MKWLNPYISLVVVSLRHHGFGSDVCLVVLRVVPHNLNIEVLLIDTIISVWCVGARLDHWLVCLIV